MTTHVLANALASLCSKGFGTSTEQLEDDGTVNPSENATGTGMGEGVGSKDVSDQITDEDQLLGTREQVRLRSFTSHDFEILVVHIFYV